MPNCEKATERWVAERPYYHGEAIGQGVFSQCIITINVNIDGHCKH
jgi:hypothetical protein